jgi:uncharacterized protein (TIGR02246 family)
MSANDTQFVVTQLIQSLVDAWNLRDVTGFSQLFSEDADYIDGNGRWLRGRRAIADLCATGDKHVAVIREPAIHIYGDVAIATFHWATIENEGIAGTITCVLLKSTTNWTITTLQNTNFS